MTNPAPGRQGQGPNTAEKERVLGGLFHMNLFVASKYPASPYFHFDLNAGCGYNHEVQIDGSPLVFAKAVRHFGLKRVYAHFVDSDRELANELVSRLCGEPNFIVHHGDNREFISAIPSLIELRGASPRAALGSVLSDPNGMGIHWRELADLARSCPRLDLIINYSASVWRRERAAGYAPATLLDEHLASLHKQYWHVQEPRRVDRLGWMILVGRNFPMKNWSGGRLYDLASKQGRESILRTLSVRERNYDLFEDVRDLPGISETPGLPGDAKDRIGPQRQHLREVQPTAGDGGAPPEISGLGSLRHAGQPDRSLS